VSVAGHPERIECLAVHPWVGLAVAERAFDEHRVEESLQFESLDLRALRVVRAVRESASRHPRSRNQRTVVDGIVERTDPFVSCRRVGRGDPLSDVGGVGAERAQRTDDDLVARLGEIESTDAVTFRIRPVLLGGGLYGVEHLVGAIPPSWSACAHMRLASSRSHRCCRRGWCRRDRGEGAGEGGHAALYRGLSGVCERPATG
jgi:hypothetical protein